MHNTDVIELEGEILDLQAQVEDLNKQLAANTQPQAFERRVAELRKIGCSPTEALSKARQSDPEAFDAYQASSNTARPIHKRAPVSKSVVDFEDAVEAVVMSKRCTRDAAMSEVRKRRPDLFKAYQEA